MSMDMETDTVSSTDARRHLAESQERSSHVQSDEKDSGVEDEDITIDTDKDQEQTKYPIQSLSPIKRPKRNPSVKCPICHEFVAPGQYRNHYQMELAHLESGASVEGKEMTYNLTRTRGKRGAAIAASKQFIKGKQRGSQSDNEKRDMLRDIQKRKAARLNNKDSTGVGSGSGRRTMDLDLGLVDPLGGTDDAPATCFICNERLFGSLDDINSHIDTCLSNPQPSRHAGTSGSIGGGYSSSGTNTPVSGGASRQNSTVSTPNERISDSFEEYTWAGQTRIRATALFEGGMSSLGSGSGSRSIQEDVDDDLNVEDDEEDEYGDPQFTERDVVVDDEDLGADELREIVLGSSSTVQRTPTSSSSPTISRNKVSQSHFGVEIKEDVSNVVDDEEDEEIDLEGVNEEEEEEHRVNALISAAFASGDTRLVIDALRAKIKQLERANKNVPSCLICLEPYTVPLTSIVCWHVHCEGCWMKTLGSKKLCPQCQKITLPKDLRRIYL
ncbi:hypothetical protein BGZ51_009666 [Haplosporangium sp. Z 767]|nr:hypothetical protein BGZ51_009666 [Haplosporangium sp. Z 767]KAF9191982.1 hypothetical protein BGZ50_008927 [Haplosporangium sp. Z 11]